MKWQRIVFSQLYLEPSRNGIYKSQENHGTGIKIINMGELFGYDFIADQPMKRISMTDSEIDRFCLQNGDLLFGRRSLVESGAGKCSLIDNLIEKTTFESSIIRVRLDSNLALPKFYYYWFKSLRGSGAIRAIVTGTNVKGIKGSDLKNITVDYPSIITQQKIADILSKYDDLIENNRRRIELLERSARLLYKEWFVRLRFPGHEHTPIIDGIPEGWEKGQVSDFYKTASGGTPSRKNPDFFTGDINWVKTQELNNSFIFKTDEKITEEAIKNSSAKIFPAHTVLVAMYGATIGQTAILANSATTNQACCGLLPDCHIANYIHCFLFFRENKQILANLSLGAAQNNISQEIIRNFPMLLPSKKVMDIFWEFTNRIFEQIKILEQQNQKLKQARDILLPKLMNGEIEV
ncbi:MAG: restriction endonuclease subunit S [Microcystis aeruginosa Ma_MB_S_20031200_S102]|uniref:Restriction endonuclease subunit S n=1 Tax=Microcystis aeruginosa Ma_MB_S_20031200_S102 TaxID=2486254 RepID=A0A552ELP0_MICAE|nr:MAG: restriction endonuclease subunit S [Microcystis aeruginosa Ma_MB_S_20031200_S102D]TRU35389.1 MAG: restriction endonuclease subunit S [Microcystis aeruginosa Ma_MB_S_20031200_S102]